MNKQELLDKFTSQLRQQLATMADAAKNSHAASTGEEAKQEGKYDTRGLEASYLAEAQAEQTQQLAQSLHIFESLKLENLSTEDAISPGALVETELNGQISYYLLTPCAGGLIIDYEMGELTTLSPDAPLYQKLLNLQSGDLIDGDDIMILDVQ